MNKLSIVILALTSTLLMVGVTAFKTSPTAILESITRSEIPPLDFHQVPHHINAEVAETLFGEFVARHAKSYQTEHERAHRLKVFTDNLHFMVKHNKAAEKGKYNFTVGITTFADLTNQEYIDTYLMKNTSFDSTGDDDDIPHDEIDFEPLPEADPPIVNWLANGCVGPIRNQGSCGSCWAFTTTALVEGAYAQKTGKLFDLSEQQLVDCDTVSHGCGGGWVNTALQSVINKGGHEIELLYPYCGCSGNGRGCYFNKFFSIPISSYTTVANGGANTAANELAMQSAVAQRCGISAYIYASAPEFQHYTGGIFDLASCPKSINHAVTNIGYMNFLPPFPPTWILRNSWGTGWGLGGYFFMAKGKHMCGIGSYSYFANA